MKKDIVRETVAQLFQAFSEKSFLRMLGFRQTEGRRLLRQVDWTAALRELLPLKDRITCAQVLELCRPMLDAIAPEPEEGWMKYAYQSSCSRMFGRTDTNHTPAQQDGVLCYLQVLQVLLDEERLQLPFDPMTDFCFCREEELAGSMAAEEYRQFMVHFRQSYIYEILRLGREVTPFRALDHIAGVHHVSMTVARSFAARGGLVDLAIISGAAAGHDLGKFGCRPGERVPYLHYHYTSQWFTRHNLTTIGHIAANHSVWDLEIENLSAESLILVYSDFRVKQERNADGSETARIYSLTDAFDVILNKLDNVDAAKTRRYRFVYAKLKDFEEHLRHMGADVELTGTAVPHKRKDPALMNPEEVVDALRRTAVEHNIRLMHRLSHDQLFASILEAAHSEKEWGRLRAYISIFEEYFTYLSSSQKVQTLEFLYEQLLNPDGDIRRQAAILIGQILAHFHSGYKKEQPADAPEDPELELPFRLWSDYLQKLIRPDRRLTPPQVSKIRYTAKLVVDSVLKNCSDADAPRFLAELMRHYDHPESADGAAFALMDTVVNLPARHCTADTVETLVRFASYWLRIGTLSQKAAALYLFSQLLKMPSADDTIRRSIANSVAAAQVENNAPLLSLQAALGRSLGLDISAQEQILADPAMVSNVFLDNLKTATPWILKALGVEYLLDQVGRNSDQNVLHIATHFSNLLKVSEHVVVRRMAGKSLLKLAPVLTPDRRNEIAVELSKALETGQSDLSRYIPEYLGRFALWLTSRELDEVIDQMEHLLSSPSPNVVSAALSTVGSMLEYYAEYAQRFSDEPSLLQRRRRLAGLLLKGLASPWEDVQQEALRILGEGLFASQTLSYQDKTSLFVLCAKKILCLAEDSRGQDLTFFYTSSALSHLYRFIILHHIDDGPFRFDIPGKVAFFPGTFDPFSLSHKGIVQAIRDLGFEVYLAIDEFSWSKKAQPSLIRRQLVSMSVADEFDVYLFPHHIPVNLTNSATLDTLREVFAGRDLYLAVGSDVVANASSYKTAPSPGSVQHMNHIVFRRASLEDGNETSVNLDCILGDVLQLQLPTHLEDISSTRIRENIDLGRDISNLIDPSVQDYIYRNSLYLREPQYKRLLRAGDLDFSCLLPHETAAQQEAADTLAAEGIRLPRKDPRDTMVVLRDIDGPIHVLGALTMRTVTSTDLYDALGSAHNTNYIRDHSAGRICLITGIHAVRATGGSYDITQLLLTEALFRALGDDCGYAVFYPGEAPGEAVTELMLRSGFLHTPGSAPGQPLMLTDMRSPVALIQNLATTLKEPFSSDPAVLETVRMSHIRFQQSVAALYPGTAVLSLNAELIYHRLVRRITEINGVPAEPTFPRVLGEKMCAPFGKILRGNVVPNTVTKTIHTDKVFAQDLRSFTIREFPGYAPLASQIRTIRAFRREVILVDDLLHSGARVKVLEPLLRKYNVPVDRVLVGLMSGRGKDLMAERGIDADCVYFIPNLRAWFVESTMYPFIGGDAVADAIPSVPGLTPAVNLIMPYAYPQFYRECGREAVFRFSRTCIENSRNILLALESSYRSRYARNLTLSRLSEAVILPLSPDKGNSLRYDPNLAASTCLEADLQQLLRLRESLE